MQLCWIGTCLSQSSVLLVKGLAVLQDFRQPLALNLFCVDLSGVFVVFVVFVFSFVFVMCLLAVW